MAPRGHAEGAIATLFELVDAVEGGLDLLGGEAVGGNLLNDSLLGTGLD